MATRTSTDPVGRLRSMVSRIMDLADGDPADHRRVYAEWARGFAADQDALAADPSVPGILVQLGSVQGYRTHAAELRSALGSLRKSTPRPTLRAVDPDETTGIDVPGAGACPPGYRIGDDGVWRAGTDEAPPVLVCREPMGITGRSRDDDTGQVQLTLSWRHGGTWRSRTVVRGVAMDTRRLVALADEGLPIDSTTAGRVVEYLAAAEVASGLPVRRATATLGWLPGSGYQWGSTTIGAAQVDLIAEEGAEQIADGLRAGGTIDGWQSMWSAAAEHPRLALAVYASIAPLLLGVIADAPAFVLDYSGRSSTGKTTAMRLAASVWGCPDDVIGLWSDTPTAIERRAALLRHLPTMLDDTKHARSPEGVARALYDVCASRGRGRGTVRGMQRRAVLRTVLLSTGERPATSFSQDAGSRARTLCVSGQVMRGGDTPGNRTTTEWLLRMTGEHYGHVGPALARYLEEQRRLWPKIGETWRTMRAQYHPDRPDSGILGRASGYLALLELAGFLAQECDTTRLAFRPAAIEEARAAAVASAADADRPLAALADLLDYMRTHWTDVYREGVSEDGTSHRHTPDRPIGRWDADDTPGIVRAVAERALREVGHSLDDVIGVWRERGWLVVDAEGRPRRRMRIGAGAPVPLLAFTRAALDAVG